MGMLKLLTVVLSLVLLGCAATPQQQARARTGTRARPAGPNLDAQYEWGSRMGAPGTHLVD